MKALLLADWYQGKKYSRNILLAVVVFAAVSIFRAGTNNTFFSLYAMLMAGIMSMNLLAYDEQSHWNIYAQIMPITRRQQVSGKYAISLVCTGAAWGLFAVIYTVMAIRGEYAWGTVLTVLAMLLAMGLLSPAILLPVVFRYGVTKGRVVYIIVLMATAAIGAGLMVGVSGQSAVPSVAALPGWMLPFLFLAVAFVLFALSWRLAIRWYEKREL